MATDIVLRLRGKIAFDFSICQSESPDQCAARLGTIRPVQVVFMFFYYFSTAP